MTGIDVPVEKDEVLTTLEKRAESFATLVRSLGPDGEVLLANSDWTAADAAAHVVSVFRRALGDMRRSSSPADTARLNALCLSEFAERDPQRVADLFAADASAAIGGTLRSLPEDLEFPFHAGITTTVVPASCVLLGELLIHGYDIAAATGRKWTIDAKEASLVLLGTATLWHGWLRRGRHAPQTFELRLAGESTPLVVAVTENAVHIQYDSESRATVIEADPVEMLLEFPYRRTAPMRAELLTLASHFEPL